MWHVYIVKKGRVILCVCKSLALAEKYIADVSGSGTTPADYSIHPAKWIEA